VPERIRPNSPRELRNLGRQAWRIVTPFMGG